MAFFVNQIIELALLILCSLFSKSLPMKNLSALISVQFTVFVGFAFIFSSHSEKKIIPVLKYTSIEGLFLKGKINVSVKSLGGYQEKCIQFELKNITLDTVYVHIEAGRRLVCKDSTMQDIFLVKENKIRLLPLEAQQVEGGREGRAAADAGSGARDFVQLAWPGPVRLAMPGRVCRERRAGF